MERPVSLSDVLVGLLVLAGSVATLTCALLSFVADREQEAIVFAAGGGCLAVWAAVRLYLPPAR